VLTTLVMVWVSVAKAAEAAPAKGRSHLRSLARR
jgi:hypothetical protein